MSQTVLKHKRSSLDRDTGEYVEMESFETIKRNVGQEPFFMIYVRYLPVYYSIQSIGAYRVLMELCTRCQYNTNEIITNGAVIESIRARCKISEPTYYAAIKELRKLGLVKTPHKGVIKLDPALCWTGTYEYRQYLCSKEGSDWFDPGLSTATDPRKIEAAIKLLENRLNELNSK